jgi:hypothetical protein
MNSSRKKSSGLDLAFLIYTLIGTGISFLISMFFWTISIVNYFTESQQAMDSGVLGALAFTLIALCGVPAIYAGARVVLGRDDPRLSRPTPFGFLPLFLFPIAFILGYLAFAKGILTILLAPIAQLLAAIAGVAFVIQVARQNGAMVTLRRFWAQFVTGLWVVPLVALVTEILILIPTIVVFGIGALTSESGRQLLEILSDTGPPSTMLLEENIELITVEPWFIIITLGYFAVLVPIIEEALKTMVVWPWLFRRSSSSQALMGGIIGGSGYALFEAIFLSQQGASWLPIMVGRAGATMMHAFTTGLASWGLAEGFVQKRWLRMFGSYLIAIAFHGLWNFSAVAVALSDNMIAQNSDVPSIVIAFRDGGPIYIILLSMVAVFGIPWITRKFRSQSDDSTFSPDDTGPVVVRDPRLT